eukprot:gene26000-biopygen12767
MNSCHEEGVCDRNKAGIEAADPMMLSLARDRHDLDSHPPRDMSSPETVQDVKFKNTLKNPMVHYIPHHHPIIWFEKMNLHSNDQPAPSQGKDPPNHISMLFSSHTSKNTLSYGLQ